MFENFPKKLLKNTDFINNLTKTCNSWFEMTNILNEDYKKKIFSSL